MASGRTRRLKIGAWIEPGVTVMAALTQARHAHPVYIVWDHLRWCPVACKVLRKPERAMHEADVIGASSHPNIVRLFEVHEEKLFLEYLGGPSLHDVISTRPKRRLAVSEALRAVAHIGAALEHIHGLGWVHLDIKPSNVIVSGGRPVVIDFGTARRISDPRPNDCFGTEIYMSPEEAELGTVSPESDVFSLGVCLYELITGELPYEGRTRRHPYPQLTRDPVPARHRVPSLSRRVEDLTMACLARKASERPSIPALLPAVNALIRAGPRMWPLGFDPLAHGRSPQSMWREAPAQLRRKERASARDG